MTRRTRIILLSLGGFAICCALILGTAYSQGADPFHPRSRHIWGASLLAAAYASFRGAMMLDRMLHWNKHGKAARPKLRGMGVLKSDHAINRRMAARRERVAAAQEKSDPTEENKRD
ncbi:MAG: hypothetical protein QNI84_06260 [Henriciella sp.]|nr:hypothetical protein [Henriciella sp.]